VSLTKLGDDIWGCSAIIHFGGIPLPHFMTVIRLHSGGLLVHSPIELDGATRAAVDQLGAVESILAPSWWHDMHLAQWCEAYPRAKLYGDPAVVKWHPKLPFESPLDGSKSPWSEIELLYVDRMRMFLDELAVLHRPTRTAILADLAFHLSDQRPTYLKLWFRFVRAYPGCKVPWFFKLAPRDRSYMRAKVDRLLAWDFDQLIVGHGDVIATGGKEALREAFAWLAETGGA
jgi:uncharacterized protein DUF4336